jgi:acetyl esterase/lipase
VSTFEPAIPSRPAPEWHPALRAWLHDHPEFCAPLHPKQIPLLRGVQSSARMRPSDDQLACGGAVRRHELSITSTRDGAAIPLLLLEPALRPARAVACFLHGGGMVAGDERATVGTTLDWVSELGIAVLSVGYRLAPEHPHPIPVSDCLDALTWLHTQRARLGLAAGPLLIAGVSAGGGLAAATTLLARDRGGPPLAAQVLIGAMLDDRERFPSSVAFHGDAPWDRESNRTGWSALLGEARGTPAVSPYAAPSRAADLRNLPRAYLDVAEYETFRDEVVDYAERLRQDGVDTDLHVWPGAFHGFDLLVPDCELAARARAMRRGFLARLLEGRTTA